MTTEAPALKRRFPAWLRRMDPMLAAEDTNPLHLAMEQLRASRRRRRRFFSVEPAPKQGVEAWVVLGYVLLTVALVIVTLITLGLTRRWLDRVGKEIAKPRKATWSTIPSRLQAIFGNLQYCEGAAIDIWMTGLSAREILEAHYLEARRDWIVGLIVGVTIYLIAIGFLGSMAWSAEPSVWWLGMALVAAVYLGDSIFRVGKAGLGPQELTLDMPLNAWVAGVQPFLAPVEKPAARRTLWQRFLAALQELVRLAVLLFLVVVVVGAVILGINLLARAVAGIAPFLMRVSLLPWGLVGFQFLVGWALRRNARKEPTPEEKEKKERHEQERLLRAEYAYNLYMALVVLRDPDAERWARETFPEGHRLVHVNDPAGNGEADEAPAVTPQ